MEKNKNIENFLEHVSTRKSDWLKTSKTKQHDPKRTRDTKSDKRVR